MSNNLQIPVIVTGTVKKALKTKSLLGQLQKGDIVVLRHKDIDRICAEMLIEARIAAVINTQPSMSGYYPNYGPQLLLEHNIVVIDLYDDYFFDHIDTGSTLSILENACIVHDDEILAHGQFVTQEDIEHKLKAAHVRLEESIDSFTRNTLNYLKGDKDLLKNDLQVPHITTKLEHRHVLVVVRGYDYKEDLQALKSYIAEQHPVFLAVDGGADALIEAGYAPDIIIGDMDSVSDDALRDGAELIAHAYPDMTSPALQRLEKLNLADQAHVWALRATSEDLALLLAYHMGADLIVAVGTHNNLIEYLDKDRAGMASSFLVRLRVGDKLMDAKGVNKLYKSVPEVKHLIPLIIAAALAIIALIYISPELQSFLSLGIFALKTSLGL